MRAREFLPGKESKERFVEMFSKFLPLAMRYLKIKRLPKMVFQSSIHDEQQPTFGRYVNDEQTLYVGISNRHPVDILRTVAHELQHYKQDTDHKLHADSGMTGSPEENEAHAMAGVVMRHFNKLYPEYLADKPVVSESWSKKYKKSINCSNPKGFSQRAHCAGRRKRQAGGKTKSSSINEFQEARKNLVIFDIDDTLMHTTAQIKVVDDQGQVLRSLTNQEFNNYKLQPGEHFDFGEFRDAEKFNRESEPIWPIMNKLKDVLDNSPNAEPIMLTARSDFDNKEKFLDTFRQYGIDMSRVHVHRAGNLPGDEIPAEKKAVYVRRYLNTGKYKGVWLYDDSRSNLSVFKELKNEYPDVNFHAIYVGPKGVTNPVENFHDGRNPQDKGDSKRLGVPTKSSVSSLRKYAKSHSGRKAQLAHWMANMKAGKAKKHH